MVQPLEPLKPPFVITVDAEAPTLKTEVNKDRSITGMFIQADFLILILVFPKNDTYFPKCDSRCPKDKTILPF
jgi:hypothetical protein